MFFASLARDVEHGGRGVEAEDRGLGVREKDSGVAGGAAAEVDEKWAWGQGREERGEEGEEEVGGEWREEVGRGIVGLFGLGVRLGGLELRKG